MNIYIGKWSMGKLDLDPDEVATADLRSNPDPDSDSDPRSLWWLISRRFPGRGINPVRIAVTWVRFMEQIPWLPHPIPLDVFCLPRG